MPQEHGEPAPCTPHLKALSYRFVVHCDDAVLGAHIDTLLRSLREPNPDPSAPSGPDDGANGSLHRYSLTAASGRGDGVDLCLDDVPLEAGLGLGSLTAIDLLMWDVNRRAAELSGEHLLFHSGGLEASGIGMLVPGASGSGKSTLTAGLTRAGLGYLGDELIAVELAGAMPGRLLPYPKPITVKPGSFGVLADMAPAGMGDGGGESAEGEWLVPVGEGTGRRVGRPCDPGIVIVPRYDPSAATSLVRLSETEAFLTLALHAVNMLPHGASGTGALGRLAADCDCYSLAFSDLDEACAQVLGVVNARAPG